MLRQYIYKPISYIEGLRPSNIVKTVQLNLFKYLFSYIEAWPIFSSWSLRSLSTLLSLWSLSSPLLSCMWEEVEIMMLEIVYLFSPAGSTRMKACNGLDSSWGFHRSAWWKDRPCSYFFGVFVWISVVRNNFDLYHTFTHSKKRSLNFN